MSDQYRLHIDFPVGVDFEKAKIRAQSIIDMIAQSLIDAGPQPEPVSMQYRLGCDSDRQKRNYLDLDENGRCSTKKNSVNI